MRLHDELRKCLLEILPDGWLVSLQDGDDLFALMDSIDVVRLVDLLQRRYGIQIANSEMTAENLGSLNCIAEFVERKSSRTVQEQH
jgi:acyl carrier protein